MITFGVVFGIIILGGVLLSYAGGKSRSQRENAERRRNPGQRRSNEQERKAMDNENDNFNRNRNYWFRH